MNRAAPRIDLFDARPLDEREAALVRDLRVVEALLFGSAMPLDAATIAKHLPKDADILALMDTLAADYARRGVNVAKVAGGWMLRTAPDLAEVAGEAAPEIRKLSRAATEVLAIVAYHQPVTRAEIEEIRGVSTSKGTLDVLMETGWVRLRGRRRAPGRPVTYGTTPAFLIHFDLDAVHDLPGVEEMKGAGLLDPRVPSGFAIPLPSDDERLREDEEPLEPELLDLILSPEPEPEEGEDET